MDGGSPFSATDDQTVGTNRAVRSGRESAVDPGYVELHAKSFYSFGVGASNDHELLARAQESGYPALP